MEPLYTFYGHWLISCSSIALTGASAFLLIDGGTPVDGEYTPTTGWSLEVDHPSWILKPNVFGGARQTEWDALTQVFHFDPAKGLSSIIHGSRVSATPAFSVNLNLACQSLDSELQGATLIPPNFTLPGRPSQG